MEPKSKDVTCRPFIPHGSTCEADDDRGSDFGKCGEPAYGIVEQAGRDWYVCAFHEKHHKRTT